MPTSPRPRDPAAVSPAPNAGTAPIPGTPAAPTDHHPSGSPPIIPVLAAQRFTATEPDQGRLVAVHGFTQTSACWAPIDAALAPSHDLVLVDAPGHGASAGLEVDLWAGAHGLAQTGDVGTYLGYSMGGRLCLHAALGRPDVVERLVLISATAGIDDAGQRAARRRADERLAEHLVEIGVSAFLDEWLAQPLFAGLGPDAQHRRAREANTAEGLASSLRLAGTGTQDPLWDRLAELAMPVLVVSGADDPKFTALAERLAAGIGPNAELVVVAGAGHTVHLEQPERFLAALRPWLARTRGPGQGDRNSPMDSRTP
jgi:2-succinyl-6-hydroxy-2,4-cyclohexadiene-1-carboxylate synthase